MNTDSEHIQKEEWKDEVLSSLEGMRRAEAPPFLFTRIASRLGAQETAALGNANSRISRPALAFSIAGFVILCCVNVWIAVGSAVPQPRSPEQAPPSAASSLETVSFDLY